MLYDKVDTVYVTGQNKLKPSLACRARNMVMELAFSDSSYNLAKYQQIISKISRGHLKVKYLWSSK